MYNIISNFCLKAHSMSFFFTKLGCFICSNDQTNKNIYNNLFLGISDTQVHENNFTH